LTKHEFSSLGRGKYSGMGIWYFTFLLWTHNELLEFCLYSDHWSQLRIHSYVAKIEGYLIYFLGVEKYFNNKMSCNFHFLFSVIRFSWFLEKHFINISAILFLFVFFNLKKFPAPQICVNNYIPKATFYVFLFLMSYYGFQNIA
jgi:hypothetical protein